MYIHWFIVKQVFAILADAPLLSGLIPLKESDRAEGVFREQ